MDVVEGILFLIGHLHLNRYIIRKKTSQHKKQKIYPVVDMDKMDFSFGFVGLGFIVYLGFLCKFTFGKLITHG